MVKKNYLGGLKVFLLPLFIMLLGTFSTSYASVSRDYVEYSVQNLYDNGNFGTRDTNYKSALNYILQNSSVIDNIYVLLNDYLTNQNIFSLTDVNTQVFVGPNGNSRLYLLYVFSNATSPGDINNLDFVSIGWSNNSSWLGSLGTTGDVVYYCSFNVNSSSLSFQGSGTFTRALMNEIITGSVTFNADGTVCTIQNMSCAGIPSGYVTYPWGGYNSLRGVNLVDYSGNYQLPAPPEPEQPSGDIPSNNTGTISNSSGDTIGIIDLSGIQNGINDINNSINTQGQNIVNQISGDTQKIINSITGTNTDVNPSGELHNMISSTESVVDPTVNFFSWLIDNIRTVLNSTGNYDLEIPLFGETYTIRSDFFILPDGDFKTFLQMSFIAWFGWSIIKKIRYIVYAIKCVNISSALNAVDFNPNIL